MAMLEKWAPLPDLDVVERRMRRFFEDLGVAPAVTPAADVYETGNELVVELEVPDSTSRTSRSRSPITP